MASLRRLYAYGAALAALEAWLWSLVSLGTKALRGVLWTRPEDLAGPLAAFIIGLPVFVLHWRWVQRDAATVEEERRAPIRAVALYLALALLWGPAFHAAAALVARVLEALLPMPQWVSLFPSLSWERAAAMLVLHAAVGWYFTLVLREDTRQGMTAAQALTRRWYRYLWLSYGVVWLWLGVHDFLSVFAPPDDIFAPLVLNKFVAQGTIYALGGLVVWGIWGARWWRESLAEGRERQSLVIAGFLTVWTLGGLAVAVAAIGVAAQRVLSVLFGDAHRLYPPVRTALVAGVPSLALWLAAQAGLGRLVAAWEDRRRAAVYRLLLSIIALAGLIVLSGGVVALLTHLTGVWFGELRTHEALANGLTWALLGLALWVLPWRALQAEAAADREVAHTLLRRAYLYFVLFVALMGSMGFATGATFEVLRALLGAKFHGRGFVFAMGMTLWALAVLAYHARVLWADRRAEASRTDERLRAFRVLALAAAPEAPWLHALQAEAGSVTLVKLVPPAEPPEGETFDAVVVNADDLLRLPPRWQQWLAAFPGKRLMVVSEDDRWLWLPDVESSRAAPKLLRDLALGKRPRPGRPSGIWLVLAYLGIFSLISWVLGIAIPALYGLLLAGGVH